jgi:hypothetical protein
MYANRCESPSRQVDYCQLPAERRTSKNVKSSSGAGVSWLDFNKSAPDIAEGFTLRERNSDLAGIGIAKNLLISEIYEYQALSDDWDGYGGAAANFETFMDAYHFLARFPSTLPHPKPMIGGSGVIGLYWEGNGCYASIDFDGSGFYCYIADSEYEEAGEDKVAVENMLPQRLAEVIAATADFL